MHLSESTTHKYQESIALHDYEILTDSGWQDLSCVMQTVPYRVWTVTLQNGASTQCADTHIFFDEHYNEIYAKDCLGMHLQTTDGPQLVVDVEETDIVEPLYDLSVDSCDHRYYGDGFLSHNSITSVGWLLHYCCFNSDKKVAILANKGATAREMLGRFTLMLENLPFFLQPGVRILNKGNIVFSHRSEIIAASTSSSSIRGLSINCVTGDTQIHVVLNGVEHCLTILDYLENHIGIDCQPHVLTQSGYKPFDGIVRRGLSEFLLQLTFIQNGVEHSIKCTPEHRFLACDGLQYVNAENLLVGDRLYPSAVITKKECVPNEHVYDLVNVQDTHAYYTNGLVSHNCIFMDEFAFVHKAGEFYTSTYPVISSGKDTKVIITSTPNGVGNMFYKLWQGAIQKSNAFQPFRINWYDVPGRDEAWKAETIANSSALQFAQEHECQFLGSSQTLISGDALLALTSAEPIQVQHGINYYVGPQPGHNYIMTVDVSKGRGQDYSTFSVIDVSTMPFQQVCTYRDNLISPLLYPEYIMRAAKAYNDALVVVENNDAGIVVCNSLYYDYEYENLFVQSSTRSNGLGVTMSKRVKRIGCSNLKDLIENGKLTLCDSVSIQEICTFEPKGDSYAASSGNHDDTTMNLVLFAWFVSTDAFGGLSDLDLKQLLYHDKIKEMEDDVPPFGEMHSYNSPLSSPSMAAYQQAVDDIQEWGRL